MFQYLLKFLDKLAHDHGGDLAQFALILVLVVIVAITVLTDLGTDIVNAFQSVADAL